jgi:RNA polymerase sigma-70 factor (ECF subfamily)
MDDRRRRFELLILPYLDAAYSYAHWLAPSPADADDVLQESVLRAFRGFEALRGSDVKS